MPMPVAGSPGSGPCGALGTAAASGGHPPASPLVAPIAGLKALVEQDPLLHQQAQGMFDEAWQHEHSTPLGQVQVRSFDEFLQLLNGIMTTAPEAYQDVQTQEPAGLIGFPINALLNWPMATAAGYDFFANALVNQQLRKILGYWADFLQGPASRYVLTESVSPWIARP